MIGKISWVLWQTIKISDAELPDIADYESEKIAGFVQQTSQERFVVNGESVYHGIHCIGVRAEGKSRILITISRRQTLSARALQPNNSRTIRMTNAYSCALRSGRKAPEENCQKKERIWNSRLDSQRGSFQFRIFH
jgi:hypothetical protein